jgi:5,10-methylenetetrahydromethanopterin reductase
VKAGVALWLERPLADCAELAAVAEASGFSDVWIPDHYFLRDCYAAQALMAVRTRSVRLGTAVASPLLRHPALLASSVATINNLSDGRALAGIGIGGYELPAQLGLTSERPLAAIREASEIMRALWHGTSHVRGSQFSADGAVLQWKTIEPPLYVGARGPRMLRLAGEIADGAITHGLTSAYIDFCLANMREGAGRAGRDPCELVLMFQAEVDDDVEAAVERLRPRCTVMAGGEYSEDLIQIFGLDPDHAAALRAAVRAGDPNAGRLVTDQMVHTFCVAGPKGHLADRVAEMADAGIDRVIVTIRGDPFERMVTRIETVGKALAGVLT